MYKTAAYVLLTFLFIGGGWYWYSKSAQLSDAPAPYIASVITCHDSPEHFVITRSRTETSEVGESILVKRKTSANQIIECAYVPKDGDLELANAGPTYFLDITGDYLILDVGTAPPPRKISVYDLVQQKEIYSDQYNTPTEIRNGTFTYWQPVATEVTVANCPDLDEYQANGLGAGIERRVTVDFDTLQLTSLDETRCSVRQ